MVKKAVGKKKGVQLAAVKRLELEQSSGTNVTTISQR